MTEDALPSSYSVVSCRWSLEVHEGLRMEMSLPLPMKDDQLRWLGCGMVVWMYIYKHSQVYI